MLETSARQSDVLKEWISQKLNLEKIRPNDTIILKIESEIEKIFRDNSTEFRSMIQSSFMRAIEDHLAFKCIKNKSGYNENDKNMLILREKASGRLEPVKKFKNVKFVIRLNRLTPMREITPKLEGIPIMFEAIIMYVDHPKSFIRGGKAICSKCGSRKNLIINFDLTIETSICDECKRKMKIDETSIETEFIQTLLLEEFSEIAKNNTPVKFTAKLRGVFVGDTFMGQRKRIVGIPRTDVIDETKREHPFFIDVISVEDVEEKKECILNDTQINDLKDRLNIENLVESFAPHIKNRDLEKLGMLLCIVSGVESSDLRSRVHGLFCGDPGSGKSELCKFASKIIFKGDIVDGTAVSQSGLVFGLDKLSSGQQIPKAGYVILNNGGVLLMDEFDKAGKNERKSLHSVLEQGIARYDKIQKMRAGAVITMIACSNPQYLVWKDHLTTMDNLYPVEKTILDRCDIVMRLKPIQDISKKKNQLKNFMEGLARTDENPKLLDVNTYKGFINYIRRINPVLSKEAIEKISDFFADMQVLEQNDGSLPMDQRQGQAIARLSVSFARLLMKNIVTEEIADMTIEFYKKMLETLNMKTGEGIRQINLEDAQMTKAETFWSMIERVEKDGDGRFYESDLITLLLQSYYFNTEEKITAYIEDARKMGKLLKDRGKYKKI